MRYVSTRGDASPLGFDDVLLQGLAPDGGLYVPEAWPPPVSLPDFDRDYARVAATVVGSFVTDGVLADNLSNLVAYTYRSFRHPEVAPLTDLGGGRYLLELFWGPTLSFKDYALQLVGKMFDAVLKARGERLLVLGATSGDTGSAAIEACRGLEAVDVVILYPHGRVSEIQRRQMTTVEAPNVRAVAVDGTFDDCQALVKQAFGDEELRRRLKLGAVNSINWARVAAQAAYHVWAAVRVGDVVDVVVPTGNFGNVFAAWVAKRLGAPIGRLVVGNNSNHGLTDLVEHGRLEVAPVVPTLAPAMDIQVPSNLERYLFELWGRDPQAVRSAMKTLLERGRIELDPSARRALEADMTAAWVDDDGIKATIRGVYRDLGIVLDPHTAAGWAAMERLPSDRPRVVVATAHPAKFPEAVREAVGFVPPLPAELADLTERPERVFHIEAGIEALVGLLLGVADT